MKVLSQLRDGVKKLRSPESILAVVVLLVLIYLTIPPLFVMFWKSFVSGISLGFHFSMSGYRSTLQNGLGTTVVQTLEFALGSTIVTLVVGSVIAWSTIRTDAVMRWLGYAVAFIGFAVRQCLGHICGRNLIGVVPKGQPGDPVRNQKVVRA